MDDHTLRPPKPYILAILPTSSGRSLESPSPLIVPFSGNADTSPNPSFASCTAAHRCSLAPNGFLAFFPNPMLGVSSFSTSTTVQYLAGWGLNGDAPSWPYKISASCLVFGICESRMWSSGNWSKIRPKAGLTGFAANTEVNEICGCCACHLAAGCDGSG